MGNLRAPSKDLPTIRVLADSDLILEFLINREGFVEDADTLFEQIEQSCFLEVYITDKCLKRIRLEDELGEDVASTIEKGRFQGRVIIIDRNIRDSARESCLRDFDSAEEVACVKTKLLDAIVTQNPQNFEGEDLQVWSVKSLLMRLHLETYLLLKPKSELETYFNLEISSQIETNAQLVNNSLGHQFPELQDKIMLEALRSFFRLRLRHYGSLLGKYEPDDIMNESILRLSRAVVSGKKIYNVIPWLRTTGLHVIHELSRSQTRSRVIDSPNLDLELLLAYENPNSLTSENDEIYTQLHLALQELNSKDRKLLLLRYFKQLSWKEISMQLSSSDGIQISESALRKRGSSALQRLRKALLKLALGKE